MFQQSLSRAAHKCNKPNTTAVCLVHRNVCVHTECRLACVVAASASRRLGRDDHRLTSTGITDPGSDPTLRRGRLRACSSAHTEPRLRFKTWVFASKRRVCNCMLSAICNTGWLQIYGDWRNCARLAMETSDVFSSNSSHAKWQCANDYNCILRLKP